MHSQQVLAPDKASYPRAEPPCPYFGTCGGCALQDLAYADQVVLKRERLRRALARIPGMPEIDVVGLEEPWRYRNKAELAFGESDGRVTLGFHAARSFHRVVDVEDCLLLPQPVIPVVRDLRALVEATGLPVYQPRTHQGFFRYAVVRHSQATRQMLLCLVTTSRAAGSDAEASSAVVRHVADELAKRHPILSSVSWGRADQLADVAVPQELIHLVGSEHLEDRIGPFRVRVEPFSFLQSTSVQADRMYRAVCNAIVGSGEAVAWDLYCGIGLVSLYLSSSCREVYGIDSEPRHLELARVNAALNGAENVRWVAGRAEAVLMDRRFWLQEAKPGVVVADPPRAGVSVEVASTILAARPQRIVYLSCNPSSLARDLQILLAGFPRYRVCRAQAFDMFPQTNHVETLVVLERP